MSSFTGEPGSRIAHYRLEGRIGQGGMGTVYRATDLRSDTTVAIKALHEHLSDDDTFRERFVREAHHASLLTSPYTCRVIEYWEERGRPFMAMEYIEGRTVRQMLAGGPLPTAQALELTRQTALALEEAHDKELIHRDIKPENLTVTSEGRMKVLDFGIARRLHGGTLTAHGAFIGTLTYAAPETFSGQRDRTDRRSDIYSLGATLFDMLVGEPPFKAESAFGLIRQHEQDPPPLEKLAGQPEAVVVVVRRCLEKRPEDRYQKASELVAALEDAQEALPTEQPARETIVAPPPGPPTEPGAETIGPAPQAAPGPADETVQAAPQPPTAPETVQAAPQTPAASETVAQDPQTLACMIVGL